MRAFISWTLILFVLGIEGEVTLAGTDHLCTPTSPDSMGPFYKPDAPYRSSVGKGYHLLGTVKSAKDCTPISKAKIEFWLTNQEGEYGAAHRATVVADGSGGYRFESERPGNYGFRPPHIHIRVTAKEFKPLVTQHYPIDQATKAEFDLVLVPED